MPRVRRGHNKVQRRKKIMKLAKGYYGAKSKLYRTAKEQVERSLSFAYRGRKLKKISMRRLWIVRINAGCRQNDMSYSRFMNGLKNAQITLNRKVLADMAATDPATFKTLVEKAREAVAS